METDNKEPRWASSPPPTTGLSNMESRCDVTVGNMATKWRTKTSSRRSSSLYILGCHGQCPIPCSSQPTLLIHRMTPHNHPSTTDIPRQQQRQCHVTSCTLFWWHTLLTTWHVNRCMLWSLSTLIQVSKHDPSPFFIQEAGAMLLSARTS